MRLLTTWVAFTTALLFLTACTSGSLTSVNEEKSPDSDTSWQPLALKRTRDQGGLVFYREAESKNAPAVTISLNQSYLMSLLPEVSAHITICAKPTKITAEYADPTASYLHKTKGEGEVATITAGKNTYIKVTTDNLKKPRLDIVSSQVAHQALRHLKKQTHTLSRVHEKIRCTNSDSPSKPNNTTGFNLKSSTLFVDGSAKLKHSENASNTIKSLAKKILLQKNKVKRIVVIGHTDPKGTDKVNKKLSKARAEAVVDLLIENGIDEDSIRPHGMGEEQLIIKDCAKKFPDDSKKEKACNEPNRRIEVTIFGEK